jgi:uncharacterized membrane protein
MSPPSASLLDGIVEADPIIASILIGAVVVLAGAFVVVRVMRRRRSP